MVRAMLFPNQGFPQQLKQSFLRVLVKVVEHYRREQGPGKEDRHFQEQVKIRFVEQPVTTLNIFCRNDNCVSKKRKEMQGETANANHREDFHKMLG